MFLICWILFEQYYLTIPLSNLYPVLCFYYFSLRCVFSHSTSPISIYSISFLSTLYNNNNLLVSLTWKMNFDFYNDSILYLFDFLCKNVKFETYVYLDIEEMKSFCVSQYKHRNFLTGDMYTLKHFWFIDWKILTFWCLGKIKKYVCFDVGGNWPFLVFLFKNWSLVDGFIVKSVTF